MHKVGTPGRWAEQVAGRRSSGREVRRAEVEEEQVLELVRRRAAGGGGRTASANC